MISDPNQQKLSHLLACGVLPREAELVAGGAADNVATMAVREFAKGPLTFCLLTGGAGSGKTIAAAEALLNSRLAWDGGKAWCYSPSEARFELATDLARMSSFDADSLKRLGRLERVPWLVIDDLGSELMNNSWASNLGEIINARSSGRRKTIITTNLNGEAFRARYDERIYSRIKGDGVVIGTGGQDLRRSA